MMAVLLGIPIFRWVRRTAERTEATGVEDRVRRDEIRLERFRALGAALRRRGGKAT